MLKDTFTKIYKNKNWQDIYGTESGPGSSIECSKPYLDFLQEFCNSYSIKSILDLGCGDFNLMRYFDLNVEVHLCIVLNHNLYH